jgi:hypothetical protein
MSSSTPPPSKTDAPVSSTPGPGSRNRRPISILIDELHGLTLLELDDVHRFIKRLRAARGDQPSPELVSEVVAAVGRLRQTYSKRIPISLVRAGLANVPRALLDLALFEAETRHLLRIEPVQLPAEFVEVGAGIQHDRGLLYWIVPFLP